MNKLIEILTFIETITTDKIRTTKHFRARNKQKHRNHIYKDTDLYKKLLTEEFPVEVSLQRYDKIRIKYEHPYCDYYDFCIVFVIQSDKIRLLTTFNAPIQKRMGDEL
ncbi:MAG: hypothetical protein IJJ47_07885 [Methanosphaera sp.]|nr:hypothetical protein [Methanosphaera sp.]